MGLNANKVKASNKDYVAQEPLKAGNHASRVVQVIDLGLQPQRPYKGQEKPPAHFVHVTYELSHEFMKDAEGNNEEDKPRWISEDFPFLSLQADRAKSTKRYLAIDPEQTVGGDFTKLVGMPCTVAVVQNPGNGKHAGTIFNNVAAVSGPIAMPGYVQPELVNQPKVFVLDDPDMEVFLSLPEWLQDKIKGNLEYAGSPLEKALGGASEKPVEEEAQTPEVDEEDVY